jgi:hypothetical protein
MSFSLKDSTDAELVVYYHQPPAGTVEDPRQQAKVIYPLDAAFAQGLFGWNNDRNGLDLPALSVSSLGSKKQANPLMPFATTSVHW